MTEKLEKGEKQDGKEMIEIFLQGESISEVELIRVPQGSTVREMLGIARASAVNLPQGDDIGVFVEDQDAELALDSRLKDVGVAHRARLHVHRCRRVGVTVNFNGSVRQHPFASSQTVAKVKKWADKEFELRGVDATEHALQITGTRTRPDEDVHVGALVSFPNCQIAFDLVPKKRVEG
jgi:hypothetical protein